VATTARPERETASIRLVEEALALADTPRALGVLRRYASSDLGTVERARALCLAAIQEKPPDRLALLRALDLLDALVEELVAVKRS
jgi:hypothetical protein